MPLYRITLILCLLGRSAECFQQFSRTSITSSRLPIQNTFLLRKDENARSTAFKSGGKKKNFNLFAEIETDTIDKIDMKYNALEKEISGVKNTFSEKNGSIVYDAVDSEQPFASYIPILALCWFVTFISALDRVAMSVAILPLSTEFHLTDTIKGEISSLFSVGYGLLIIPMGLLVSALSPKNVMAFGIALWSLATIGTPIAASLINVQSNVGEMMNNEVATAITYSVDNIAPLLFIRAVIGAAESCVLPCIQIFLSNWVPASKKSLAVAFVISGFQVGTVCAYILSPWVLDNLGGWRELFYLYGAIGALWVGPWLLLAKDFPSAMSGTSESELKLATDGGANLAKENMITAEDFPGLEEKSSKGWGEVTTTFNEAPWKDMVQSKAVWGLTIAHAANNWGLYNSLSWNTVFYSQQYGLNVKESAFLSVLPSIVGVICGVTAGFSADKIIDKVCKDGDIDAKTNIRKTFQALALIGPGACLFALANQIPDDPSTAQALLTGAVALQAFNVAGYSAGPQEKAGEKWSGLLYSITTLPGVMFGSLGVYVTGQILDLTNQNWSGVFALNGAVFVLGGLSFLSLYDSKKEFD